MRARHPRIMRTLTALIAILAVFLAGCDGACIEKYAPCNQKDTCCDGFVCQPIGKDWQCLPLAGNGSGETTDGTDATITNPSQPQCIALGKACVNLYDCCATNPDNPDTLCRNGVCCKITGQACVADSDCCQSDPETPGIACTAGTCQFRCIPVGEKKPDNGIPCCGGSARITDDGLVCV